MLIYTVVYTYPSDRKHLVLSVQTIMILFSSSQLMLIHKKCLILEKTIIFSIFSVSY